jgi:hypothetical protein
MMTTPSHAHHGLHWAPETRAGTWALSLAGLALGGTVAIAVALAAGMERAETFSDNWLLTAAGVAILAGAAASVATGATAVVRHHERSWSVLAAVVVGALLTALSLQQVAEGLGWLSG